MQQFKAAPGRSLRSEMDFLLRKTRSTTAWPRRISSTGACAASSPSRTKMAGVDKPAVDSHKPSILTLPDCRNLLASAREYKDGLLIIADYMRHTAISMYLAKH